MGRKKTVTLDDVAQAAGVSRMAVSVALNPGRSGTRVSANTKARIEDVAAQLGYRGNAVARMLRTQRTNTIGFLLGHNSTSLLSPFTHVVAAGIQEASEACGMDLLLLRGQDSRNVDDVKSGKVDGLILNVFPGHPILQIPKDQLHFAVVSLGDPYPGMASVFADDVRVGQIGAEHLYQRGHRHVWARSDQNGRPSARTRVESFMQTAQALGMKVEFYPAEHDERLSEAEFEMLSRPRSARPTAAFCWADGSATTLMWVMGQRGWEFPRDMAVVCVDGLEHAMRFNPQVTAIRIPWDAVARKAVDLIMTQLDQQLIEDHIRFPVELIQGAST